MNTISDIQVLSPESEAERRERWLAQRRLMITGTDVAAIMLAHEDIPEEHKGFRSAIEVWQDKRGEGQPFPDTERLRFGRRFQPAILEEYAERVGQPVEHTDPYAVTVVPSLPLGASLDARRIADDRRPVDAKNVERRGGKWGEAGTDDFPLYYQLQLAVQMMATGTDAADLAVCFGGCSLSVYTLHRNPATEALIRERVQEWWNRCVVQGHRPEADASRGFREYLSRQFTSHSQHLLTCSAGIAETARRLVAVREAQAKVEAERMLCENTLIAEMGDAAGIAGVCTYKFNKPSTVTNYPAVLEALRERGYVSDDHLREALAEHTTTKPGPRVFRFNPKGLLLTNGTHDDAAAAPAN